MTTTPAEPVENPQPDEPAEDPEVVPSLDPDPAADPERREGAPDPVPDPERPAG